MGKRKTTAEYVAEASESHSGKYDYSKVVYVDNKTPVEIICPVHKSFFQRPSSHLKYGCRHCGAEERSRKVVERAAAEFPVKAAIVHGETYLYDKVVYVHSAQYVIITCRIHGDFPQTPHNHLLGQGCPECYAQKCLKSNEDYVRECSEAHNNLYDYSVTKYLGVDKNVDIRCKKHGVFTQNAGNHLHNKAGCPDCCSFGYQQSKPGSLYVIKSDNITKVGITNTTGNKRCKQIAKSSGRKFEEILSIRFDNGKIPLNIETRVLRELENRYLQLDDSFNGSTECFLDVDCEALVLRITQLASEHLTCN